jgi:hypothetical protein
VAILREKRDLMTSGGGGDGDCDGVEAAAEASERDG